MLKEIFLLARKFVLKPGKAFEETKKTKMDEAFKYLLILSLFMSLLFAAVDVYDKSSFTDPENPQYLLFHIIGPQAWFILSFILGYVTMIISSVFFGLWLHLWAYILGCKKGLRETLKIVFYGQSPRYLFGWIPYVSLLASVWSWSIQFVGLKKLHSMKPANAAASILIAVLVPVLALLALIFWLFSVFNLALF